MKSFNRLAVYISATAALMALAAQASPIAGRMVTAVSKGDITFSRGRSPADELKDGMSLTDGFTVKTGNGSLCASLTPGAILCLDSNSRIRINKLQHGGKGLPGEGGAKQNSISLTLQSGSMLLYAGRDTGRITINVNLGDGTSIMAGGGDFTASVTPDGKSVKVKQGTVKVVTPQGPVTLTGGRMLTLRRDSSGGWQMTSGTYTKDEQDKNIDSYRKYFGYLAPLTFNWDWSNLPQLNSWIGGASGIILVDDPEKFEDVSPSVRTPGGSRGQSVVLPPVAGTGGKWTRPDVWHWYKRQGVIRGVNYLPHTAVNSIEMWQAATFDPATIKEELKLAEKAGINSLRIFIPFVVWQKDPDGLKDRMDQFLDIADKAGMKTVLVLFDNRSAPGMEPKAGPQPPPIPGVYNSRWVSSLKPSQLPESAGMWPQMKSYIEDIVGRYADDDRVLMWDLFNEPAFGGKAAATLPLLDTAFGWIRDIAPDQPVSAGIGRNLPQKMKEKIINRSDLVTLADYENRQKMMGLLAQASTAGRPVICTGWLRRGVKNDFRDILPLFAKMGVGWYNWGLTKGRAQLYYPWDSKPGDPEPEIWEQDLLQPDGTPFDSEEIKLIKGFTFDIP